MEKISSSSAQNSEEWQKRETLKKEIKQKINNYINNLDDSSHNQYLYLLIVEDSQEHHLCYLENSIYEIGRRHDADIILRDLSVSRTHATIVKEYNQEENLFFYKIIDGSLSGNKSKNGLVINNKKFGSKYLEHGDLIIFGDHAKARFFVIDKNSQNQDFFNIVNFEKTNILDEDSYAKKTLNNNNYIVKEIDSQSENIRDYIAKLGSFAELSPYPIIEINLQGKITYYNPATGLLFPDLKDEKMNHPVLINLLKAEHKIHGNLFVREVFYQDKIFEQYIHYLPELKVIRIYIFDFTKRKRIEAKLKDSEAKYRAVVEQISEGIFLFNAENNKIIEANESVTRILGFSLEELIGENIETFLNNKNFDFCHKLRLLKQTKASFREELRLKAKNRESVYVELSISIINYQNQLVFCSVFRDIGQRKLLEEQLKFQAYHDSLTGLYKRNYFREYAAKKINTFHRKKYYLAVAFFDIDYFKEINDSYGHDVGDMLLQNLTERIKYCLKKRDCLARWGGDEFVALFGNIKEIQDLIVIVERILQSVRRPFVFDGVTINASTSIGVAVYPLHGDSVDCLLKKADEALYETKRNGRDGYTIAGSMMN
ncbi:diguanylate cyclase domain-containing protein [Cyanobacterium aponinum]|uniref:Diguanylate cyclase with PAS/PAC sensor n=1 Tax=Cyanobacterium aponinum (strain PCC 10605) TaxID=755178 RepID=K9Z6Y7_CYAAP|nr:diguanylate cyclase [Cyanobacterium aponinum]AFZ54904.1 diguanylate cyclase with PAS/PAC sensor [Cyanobacterium aponinum PCC 10605]